MSDRETLNVYAAKAQDYDTRFGREKGPGSHLQAFMDVLPAGGRVLDLGCGTGAAARHLVAAGFECDAWDASPEMAAIAAKLPGVTPEVRRFDSLTASDTYDGIHANFSLLHAPRAEMPENLARISAALKAGGHLHLGLKTGTGEKRDDLGRFYAYFTDAELTGLLDDVGLHVLTRATGEEVGLAGTSDPWIIMLARKS